MKPLTFFNPALRTLGLRMSLLAGVFLILTAASAPAHARKIDERPSALVMVADAVLMRPVMLGSTVAGVTLFTVTLPFSTLGGNVGEVGKKFVVVPFKATFMRCLGCTRRHLDDPDQTGY